MTKTLAGLCALGSLVLSGATAAQQPTLGVYGLKFPVSNFERSVDYYTTYFPL